jgi:flagellar motor switch protein FliN/FliY
VTETIEYEQFDQAGEAGPAAAPDSDISRLSDIPMELSVEIGRTHMTVGETLDLRAGSVVGLERQAGEAADLLVNGTPIARGEVIVVDEQYGLRVTEILDARQEPGAEGALPGAGQDGAAGAGEPRAEAGSADGTDAAEA